MYEIPKAKTIKTKKCTLTRIKEERRVKNKQNWRLLCINYSLYFIIHLFKMEEILKNFRTKYDKINLEVLQANAMHVKLLNSCHDFLLAIESVSSEI